MPTAPVDHSHQVHESFLHGNVLDVTRNGFTLQIDARAATVPTPLIRTLPNPEMSGTSVPSLASTIPCGSGFDRAGAELGEPASKRSISLAAPIRMSVSSEGTFLPL